MAIKAIKHYEEPMSNAVILSIAAHLLVLSFFIVKAVFLPDESLDYESAIRVDIVGLPEKYDPDKKIAPLPPPEPPKPEQAKEEKAKPAPEPVVEKEKPTLKKEVEPDTVNLNQTKAKQAEALKKLKAMAALEKIEQEIGEGDDKKNKKQQSQPIRGNIISHGSQLSGINKLQHENYISTIDSHVKQYWRIPQWLAKKNLRAQARIKIDDNGNVIEKVLVKSSGNSSYDDAVLETISNATPFPKPPVKFVSLVGGEGILLGFPE